MKFQLKSLEIDLHVKKMVKFIKMEKGLRLNQIQKRPAFAVLGIKVREYSVTYLGWIFSNKTGYPTF